MKFCLINADVGPEHLVKMCLIVRRVAHQFDIAPYEEGGNKVEEITRNVKGLTHGMPGWETSHASIRGTRWGYLIQHIIS